jgi:nitrogen fixation/metabolism regulation signal transduction histidine kinase
MFKSIQYKLYIYTFLLVLAAGLAVYLVLNEYYVYSILSIVLIFISLYNLGRCYAQYNKNIIFLLNALDNGDYSFRFSENKMSLREREMNKMMNRIKDILSNARKEVIENEHFLSIILESVDTGIIIMDNRGIVQRVNRSALDMLGMPMLSHIKQLQTINNTLPQVFMNLQIGDTRQISLINEKEEFKVSVHVSNIMLKRGMMRVFTISNIGSELELNELESWTKLIRVMTHEIMNSIAPITSLSEIMQIMIKDRKSDIKELKVDVLKAFETIHGTATGLLTFVDSYRKFLAVPKPEKENFNIIETVKKVIFLNETTIKEHKINVEVTDEEPVIVFADEKLIFQVLLNLTKNAIEVLIESGYKQLKYNVLYQSGNCIYIDVCNAGKPIPPEVLPNIFIPFFTTKEGGSGIGLSVSRYIMRLHGGTLHHFVSKEGLTVFRVELPKIG